ncbi:MAG: glycosyltransferase [Desulfuromonas sp.]|nr:glycosyltransferase [Desulfuromonas sp.]
MRIAQEQEILSDLATKLPQVQRVVVFAPHPDDEVFGCGGTLCQLQTAGAVVSVHILTDGVLGGDNRHGKLQQQRVEESRAALQLLGVSEPVFWQLPDRGLSYGETLIERLANVVNTTDADLVFIPAPTELHPDHQVLALAGSEALRRLGGDRHVAFYEVSSPLPTPNLLLDITAVEKCKLQAMECFVTQQAQQPYAARISGLNSFRAYSIGGEVSSAEAFVLVMAKDIDPLLTRLFNGALAYRRRLGYASCPDDLPLVSIIVRSIDRSTLNETLDSLALQTYSNIEIVVVNAKGGKHRPLGDCCGNFPLTVINQDGPALQRARAANVGMAAGRGRYLGLLDDDDTLAPDHIYYLVSAQQKSSREQVVYSCCQGRRRDDSDHKLMATFAETKVNFARLMLGNAIPIHSVLFPATVLEHGAEFDEDLDLYEDWDFWLQLSRLLPFVFVDRITCSYYLGGDSGASPFAADVDKTNHAALILYDKWSQQLNAAELKQMGTVFLQERGQLDAERKQSAELLVQRDELKKRLKQCDAEILNLNHSIAQLTNENAALAATRDQLLDSNSWRLSAPVRICGRRLRQISIAAHNSRTYLQRYGLSRVVHKAWTIFRHEGFSGLKRRLRHRSLTSGSHQPVACFNDAIKISPAVIVRHAQGNYALSSQSKGYTYVPPRPPENLQHIIAAMQSQPQFSILVPVYDTPVHLLEKLLISVTDQWYPHWQLILADDASPALATREFLAQLDDHRIEVLTLVENSGIAGATNAALAKASGDYVVLLDHDDELTADCLYELAQCIDREDPDYVYSDEDKIDRDGFFTEPHFKPDWSPDTMMSTMYTCHVSCIKRSFLNDIGGLRSSCDGCQDWDMVLRLSEKTRRISHVAKVLYHWRIIPGSTAEDLAAKSYVLEASKRVRLEALERRGLSGTLETIEQVPGYFRVNYALQGTPLISIIVPTRDNEPVLRCCLESLRGMSSYHNYEIIIVDNGSVSPASISLLDEILSWENVTVLHHDAPFNFSELNNLGAANAKGELLLFLNDDTEILTTDWLERLGGYGQLAHVGAVGAKLLYPGGDELQHAGILNLDDGPVHAFLRQAADNPGYFMRNLLEYNWLAVTGACMMVARSKFKQIGGFDETLPIAYNDVELCMRLYEAGYYNVVCPAVRLIHHESLSRGLDHHDEQKLSRLQSDKNRLAQLHPQFFQHDPFYNTNLHPNGTNFELME